MGIYINGVEMPKSCGHCFMNHICERIPTQKAMFVTKRLKGCPIVQAREPKRGEWIKRTHDTLIAQVNFAYCSECGQPIMHEHTRPLWNYCPNCGADMREREGE